MKFTAHRSYLKDKPKKAAFDPALTNLPITRLKSTAFVRIETASDLFDACYLLASGTDVAFEPVPGSLSGFANAPPITAVRRVAQSPHRLRVSDWCVPVTDGPLSIATAIRTLVTHKRREKALTLNLAAIIPGDRSALIATIMTEIATILQFRAETLLTACEIAAIMDRVSMLGTGLCVAQYPYGAPEWGPMMRREIGREPGFQNIPPVTEVTGLRNLICYSKPDREDLERVFSLGKSFGLINATVIKNPWFAGMSADGQVPLGNHCLAPRLKLDLREMPDQQAQWDACRLLGRALYVETCLPVPEPLSSVWTEQAATLHLSGGTVLAASPEGAVDRLRHMTWGAYKMAEALGMPHPLHVPFWTKFDEEIAFDPTQAPDLVDRILDEWDGFLARTFVPER